MSLRQRLARLERGVVGGSCPECGDWPMVEINYRCIGEDKPPAAPQCPVCGREPLQIVVWKNYEENAANEPTAENRTAGA